MFFHSDHAALILDLNVNDKPVEMTPKQRILTSSKSKNIKKIVSTAFEKTEEARVFQKLEQLNTKVTFTEEDIRALRSIENLLTWILRSSESSISLL